MNFEIENTYIICIICIIMSGLNIYIYRYNCNIQYENNLNLLKIIYWDEQIQNEKKNNDIFDEKVKIINNTLNHIIESNNKIMLNTQILLDEKNLNLLKIIYWDEQIQNEKKNNDIFDEKVKIINNTLNHIIESNNEIMLNTQILLDEN